MSVAVYHHLPTGGALRVLAEWLARTRADEVTIYTRNASSHEFVELGDVARVVERPLHAGAGAVPEMRRLWRMPAAGRELAAEIDAAGHDAVFCFASVMTQAPDVLPYLRTPSLYYAPEPLRSAYEPADLVWFQPGWRTAITRAGLNPIERRRRSLDRRFIRAAPRIVTHSRFTSDVLRTTYGVRSDVVLLGVDSERFTPGDGTRAGHVLSVGAIHPLKGHEQVIDAVATIPEPRPGLVVIADRGVPGVDLERRAQERGVLLDVRRGISVEEVVGLYRRAAVVACAQIREPFGLVPLEAMACATPVVAVDEGGFRETVRDGDTGLLVARDPMAMGAAIASLLADDALSARLGANGRRAAETEWTWQRTAAGFDALLLDA